MKPPLEERPLWVTPALGFGALFTAGAALWWWMNSPNGKIERDARSALESVLLDAESARLRDLRRIGSSRICGEVNAKNAFGAYVGFTPFYVSGGTAYIEQQGPSSQPVSFVGTMCAEENDT